MQALNLHVDRVVQCGTSIYQNDSKKDPKRIQKDPKELKNPKGIQKD